MERLTYIDHLGWYANDPDGKRLRGKCVDRLAAYENTGLEPEEIEDLTSVREITPEAEYAINKHADSLIERMDALLHQDDSELEAYRALGPIDHLRELVQAEKDGRLVMLPCKVGDTVYCVLTTRDCPPVLSEIKIKTIGQAADLIGRIGKHKLLSYYLTREEAEAALEGGQHE